MCNNINDERTYAQHFPRTANSSMRFLTFRDVPDFITKYVNGKNTLDFGCGSGLSTAFLKSLGLNVDGVDINQYMIKIAKDGDPEGNYDVITCSKIPSESRYYDMVFSSFVLVHAASKEELLKITKEISRVLKPNGTFILIVSSEHTYNRSNNWLSLDVDFEENSELRSGCDVKIRLKEADLCVCCYFWTVEDYLQVLEECGFKVLLKHHPLGRKTENFKWGVEIEKSPCTIFIANNTKSYK